MEISYEVLLATIADRTLALSFGAEFSWICHGIEHDSYPIS